MSNLLTTAILFSVVIMLATGSILWGLAAFLFLSFLKNLFEKK